MKYPLKVFSATIAAALLAAAALAGLGLAHWSDEVGLTGSASLGSLEWDVIPTGLTWNTNHTMRFSVGVRDNGNGPATGLVDVELEDAYPEAYGTLVLEVKNEGTIPVHVTFWVELGSDCGDLANYILLNPSLDLPYYTGIFNLNGYSLAVVSSGWSDPYTKPVSWWTTNHGTPATAIAPEDIMAGGKILKLPSDSTTIAQYDDDNIIMPGEVSVFMVWIGISSDIQEHEELMGASCSPAFTIHYIATQAVP